MTEVMILQTVTLMRAFWLLGRVGLCCSISVFDLYKNNIIFFQVENIMIGFQRLELASLGFGVKT